MRVITLTIAGRCLADAQLSETSAGDHWANFHAVAVGDDLVFGHEVVPADHEMGFDEQVEVAQEVLHTLGAFNFDLPFGMAELDFHRLDHMLRTGTAARGVRSRFRLHVDDG